MLQVLNDIYNCQDQLESLRISKKIVDYKITLKLNLRVHVFLFIEVDSEEIIKGLNDNFLFEKMMIVDLDNDSRLNEIFNALKSNQSKEARVDLGIRRRFSRLISPNSLDGTDTVDINIPIVTFYSYKGGMGRSTTLASFASHLATHQGKRVLIIDCDFEAPGFTNYFDLTQEKLSSKNGIVEYLIDRQYSNEPLDISKYIIEVGKDYSKEGFVYVMPAGNLSELTVSENQLLTQRDHYLEALARLDISSSKFIVHQFKLLIDDILNSAYKPDVILIDSRTGFNDIFAVTALTLSDVVVGFFGNNEQTKPGLQHFLDTAIKMKRPYNVVLVNSIVSHRSLFNDFKKEIDDYLAKPSNLPIDLSQDIQILMPDMYKVGRNDVLELLGTSNERKEDFVNLIYNREFADYNTLFEGIDKKLDDLFEINEQQAIGGAPEIENETTYSVTNTQNDVTPTKEVNPPYKTITSQINLKRSLLEEIINRKPYAPYAENQVFDEEFLNRRYYFRPKIYDLFNRDKFLVIGGKGTGKTTLNRALRESEFVRQLLIRANRPSEKFITANIISLEKDIPLDKYLPIAPNFEVSTLTNYDWFFKRFWLVYVWNSLALDIKSGRLLSHLKEKYQSAEPITNDVKTKKRFEELIASDDKILAIEQELAEIDSELKTRNENLIILFDQLDKIAKPVDWDRCVAPLVNYWRANQFSRIMPKIFLRSDLFVKLGNVNNKQELRSQNIDIEWSQEEIFSFFFKWVLSTSSGQFHNLILAYNDYPTHVIDNIKSKTVMHQVPTERKLLEPYVNTFFGKLADRNGKNAKFGLSYDWFFTNLKNADNTISLRPFLDLITEAIKLSLTDSMGPKPILPAYFYAAPQVRKNAVNRHFRDLADEEGNTDLRLVFEHISKMAPTSPYKKSYLKKREFDILLSEIIDNNSGIQNRDTDSLKDLLIINGIVAEIPVPGAYLNYRFAFLYKYFLGLK